MKNILPPNRGGQPVALSHENATGASKCATGDFAKSVRHFAKSDKLSLFAKSPVAHSFSVKSSLILP